MGKYNYNDPYKELYESVKNNPPQIDNDSAVNYIKDMYNASRGSNSYGSGGTYSERVNNAALSRSSDFARAYTDASRSSGLFDEWHNELQTQRENNFNEAVEQYKQIRERAKAERERRDSIRASNKAQGDLLDTVSADISSALVGNYSGASTGREYTPTFSVQSVSLGVDYTKGSDILGAYQTAYGDRPTASFDEETTAILEKANKDMGVAQTSLRFAQDIIEDYQSGTSNYTEADYKKAQRYVENAIKKFDDAQEIYATTFASAVEKLQGDFQRVDRNQYTHSDGTFDQAGYDAAVAASPYEQYLQNLAGASSEWLKYREQVDRYERENQYVMDNAGDDLGKQLQDTYDLIVNSGDIGGKNEPYTSASADFNRLPYSERKFIVENRDALLTRYQYLIDLNTAYSSAGYLVSNVMDSGEFGEYYSDYSTWQRDVEDSTAALDALRKQYDTALNAGPNYNDANAESAWKRKMYELQMDINAEQQKLNTLNASEFASLTDEDRKAIDQRHYRENVAGNMTLQVSVDPDADKYIELGKNNTDFVVQPSSIAEGSLYMLGRNISTIGAFSAANSGIMGARAYESMMEAGGNDVDLSENTAPLRLEEMSEEQASIYYYLVGKGNYEEAQRYYTSIEPQLMIKADERKSEELKQAIAEHPISGGLTALAYTATAQPIMGIINAIDIFASGNNGPTVFSTATRMSGIATEGESQALQNLGLSENASNQVASVGFSTAQFLTQWFLAGGGVAESMARNATTLAERSAADAALKAAANTSLTVMSMNAGISSFQESLDKGSSVEKATALGIATAVIEALTEIIGMDAFVGAASGKASGGLARFGSWLGETKAGTALANKFVRGTLSDLEMKKVAGEVVKNILNQSMSEGLEEAVSYVGDYLADIMISGIAGEESDFQRTMRQYMSGEYQELDENGNLVDGKKLTYEEALAKTMADAGNGMWQSLVGGAASGGLLGLKTIPSIVYNGTYMGRAIIENDQTEDFITQCLQFENTPDVWNEAKRLQLKYKSGAEITARDMQGLFNLANDYVGAQEAVQANLLEDIQDLSDGIGNRESVGAFVSDLTNGYSDGSGGETVTVKGIGMENARKVSGILSDLLQNKDVSNHDIRTHITGKNSVVTTLNKYLGSNMTHATPTELRLAASKYNETMEIVQRENGGIEGLTQIARSVYGDALKLAKADTEAETAAELNRGAMDGLSENMNSADETIKATADRDAQNMMSVWMEEENAKNGGSEAGGKATPAEATEAPSGEATESTPNTKPAPKPVPQKGELGLDIFTETLSDSGMSQKEIEKAYQGVNKFYQDTGAAFTKTGDGRFVVFEKTKDGTVDRTEFTYEQAKQYLTESLKEEGFTNVSDAQIESLLGGMDIGGSFSLDEAIDAIQAELENALETAERINAGSIFGDPITQGSQWAKDELLGVPYSEAHPNYVAEMIAQRFENAFANQGITEVVVDYTMGENGPNGMFRREDHRIILNGQKTRGIRDAYMMDDTGETVQQKIVYNVQQNMRFILGHELGHQAQGTNADSGSVTARTDSIIENFQSTYKLTDEQIQEDVKAVYDKYTEYYREHGIKDEFTMEHARQEYASDLLGQMFVDGKLVNSFLKTDRNAVQRFLDNVREFRKTIRNAKGNESTFKTILSAFNSETRRAEKMLRGALEGAAADKTAFSAGAADDARLSINDAFFNELEEWDRNGRSPYKTFEVGATSVSMQSIGIENKKLIMRSQKMNTIMRQHPEITVDIFKKIPDILEKPLLIMKSKTVDNSIVVYGDVSAENGVPVMVSVLLGPAASGNQMLDVNIVTNAYTKDRAPDATKDLIESSDILYVNENGAEEWLHGLGVQFPSFTSFSGSIGIVTYENGTVKSIDGIPGKDVFSTGDSTATSRSLAAAMAEKNRRANAERMAGKLSVDDVLLNDDAVNASVGIHLDEETASVSPGEFFSLDTWNESEYVTMRDHATANLAKSLDITEEQAKKYIDDMNGIAKVIADDRTRLDFNAIENASAFVKNAEYGGSFDFSTVCKKRRLFTGTFSAIQNALPNTVLTADDVLKIRSMMKERGEEVSCGLCYVEGSRTRLSEYAGAFVEAYSKKYPDAEYVPTIAELATPEGQEMIRTQHPELYKTFTKWMNSGGRFPGETSSMFAIQARPKPYQLATAYNGEVLKNFRDNKRNAGKVKAKNLNGGLRLQSFSDFEIIHLLDTMQVVMDMAQVGLAGQAYTKVPDFAWALGNTGMKINLSLIAKDVDENGRLVLDDVEGMPEAEAMKLRNEFSDNVGTILVVFNDDQLKAAMNDERIDFIIPFHRSQWRSSQYKAMGLPAVVHDYTNTQNEKYIEPVYSKSGKKKKPGNLMPNSYWDFNKTGKENAEKYLELCAQTNRKPKFSELLVDNGDGSYSLQPDGSTDGYWKTLIDFKMYNNEGIGVPQQPVRPDFRMDQCMRMLNDYAGGHNSFPVSQGVVDTFLEEYAVEHPNAESVKLDWKLSVDDGEIEHLLNIHDDGSLQEIALDQKGLRFSLQVSQDDAEFETLLRHYSASEVDDPKNPAEKVGYVKCYRSMAMIDGKLYSPMASYQKVTSDSKKKLEGGITLGYEVPNNIPSAIRSGELVIEKASENYNVAYLDEKGNSMFELLKDDGKTCPARFNPYMHQTNLVLNDQFTSAANRPNLVTVECWVPVSELFVSNRENAYRAEGYNEKGQRITAKDPVGWAEWNAGGVASEVARIKGKAYRRDLLLSRWTLPVRIVPNAEVAQMYMDYISGTDVKIPENVITPDLYDELKKLGAPIEKSEYISNDILKSDKDSAKAFAEFKDRWEKATGSKWNGEMPTISDFDASYADSVSKRDAKYLASRVKQYHDLAADADAKRKRYGYEDGVRFSVPTERISEIRQYPNATVYELIERHPEVAEFWSEKYYAEIGEKSPFYRAEHGDWRLTDDTPVRILESIVLSNYSDAKEYSDRIKELRNKNQLFSGEIINGDTKYKILVGNQVRNDTLEYARRNLAREGKTRDSLIDFNVRMTALDHIEEIAENAVLLNTRVAEIRYKYNRNENGDIIGRTETLNNRTFMHDFYTVMRTDAGDYLIKLKVDELENENKDTTRRAYNANDIEISPLAAVGASTPRAQDGDNRGAMSTTMTVSQLSNLVKQYDPEYNPKEPEATSGYSIGNEENIEGQAPFKTGGANRSGKPGGDYPSIQSLSETSQDDNRIVANSMGNGLTTPNPIAVQLNAQIEADNARIEQAKKDLKTTTRRRRSKQNEANRARTPEEREAASIAAAELADLERDQRLLSQTDEETISESLAPIVSTPEEYVRRSVDRANEAKQEISEETREKSYDEMTPEERMQLLYNALVGAARKGKGTKMSKFITNTAMNSPIFSQVTKNLDDETIMDIAGYETRHWADDLQRAAERIDASPDAWILERENLQRKAEEGMRWTSEDLDVALWILSKLQTDSIRTRDKSQVIEWAKVIRPMATEAGQFISAMAKYARTPQNLMMRLIESLETMDTKIDDAKRKQLEEQIVDYANIIQSVQNAANASEEAREVTKADLVDAIMRLAMDRGFKPGDGVRNSLMKQDFNYLESFAEISLVNLVDDYRTRSKSQKAASIQYQNQLGNLRTFMRNLFGNTGFYGLEQLTMNTLGTLTDMGLSAYYNKRTGGKINVRSTNFTLGNMKQNTKAGYENAERTALEVMLDVNLSKGSDGKYENAGVGKDSTSRRVFKMADKGGRSLNFKLAQKEISITLEKAISQREKILGYSLNVSDEFFKGAMFQSMINSYAGMVEQGIMTQDQANLLATQEMLYVTFQDDTFLGDFLKLAHDGLNRLVSFDGTITGYDKNGNPIRSEAKLGLGDFLVKYRVVPGALVCRAIEYSPMGYIKALYGLHNFKKSIKEATKTGKASKVDLIAMRNFSMGFARATTGSGLILAVSWLFLHGFADRKELEDDADAAAQMGAQGMGGTQLNLSAVKRLILGEEDPQVWRDGDVLVDIGFMDPESSILTAGAIFADRLKKAGCNTLSDAWNAGVGPVVGTVVSSSMSMVKDAIMDLSMMDALSTVLYDFMYRKDGELEAAANFVTTIATSALTGFEPSLLRQIAQATDPFYRDSYSVGGWIQDKFGGTDNELRNDAVDAMQLLYNKLAVNLPGLRQTVPVKTDTMGEPKEYTMSTMERIFNAMINPSKLNRYSTNDVLNELAAVYEATGSAAVYADRNGAKNITHVWDDAAGEHHVVKDLSLTYQEGEDRKKTIGETYQNIVSVLMGTESYRSADSQGKLEMLTDAKAYATYIADRRIILDKTGETYVDTSWNTTEALMGVIGEDDTASNYVAAREIYNKTKDSSTYLDENFKGMETGAQRISYLESFSIGEGDNKINLSGRQVAEAYNVLAGRNDTASISGTLPGIDGEEGEKFEHKLTPGEKVDLSVRADDYYFKYSDEIVSSEEYRNLDAAGKAELLSDARSYALYKAKQGYVERKNGVAYEDSKWTKTEGIMRVLGTDSDSGFAAARRMLNDLNEASLDDMRVDDETGFLSTVSRGAMYMTYLNDKDYTDDEKVSLYSVLQGKSGQSNVAKIQNLIDAGLTFEDATEVYSQYSSIDNTQDSFEYSVNEQTRFETWLNDQNFTDSQRDAIMENFKYFINTPQDADRTTMILSGSGMSTTEAMRVSTEMDEAVRALGDDAKDSEKNAARYQYVLGSSLNDTQRQSVIASIQGTDSIFGQIDAGVARDIMSAAKSTGDYGLMSMDVGSYISYGGTKYYYTDKAKEVYASTYADIISGMSGVNWAGSYTTYTGGSGSVSEKMKEIASAYAAYAAITADGVSVDLESLSSSGSLANYKKFAGAQAVGISPVTYMNIWMAVQETKYQHSGKGQINYVRSTVSSMTSSSAQYNYMMDIF